jgi:transposase
MKKPPIQTIDLQMDEVQALLERARTSMSPDDYARLEAMVDTLVYLLDVLEDKRTTIDRLRKLLFGSGSEKTRDVIKPDAEGAGPARDAAASHEHSDPNGEASKRKGHGRNGADAYTGAEKVRVPCESLKPGDPCPDCKKGKVYEMAQPGVLVRIVGQAPVQARVYELQKLRCNLCGKIFTAPAPPGVGDEKYDATAAGMIAVLKYGSGLPFNRLEGLQGSLGIPLPASTQWDIINDAAAMLAPVHEELIRRAAQGEVLHNDDTTMTILELTGKRARARALAAEASACAEDMPERAEEEARCAEAEPKPSKDKPERKGVFTSGVVSVREGRRIALFFTGREHAGENLAKVLAQRAAALEPPIQMCDALSRNLPGELQTILGHCLAHGRRQFVDVVERFPEECRTILETLAEVYRNDAVAREQGLSKEARLEFHQSESGPVMAELKAWFLLQFEERLVEPNSALGQAIAYMLRHWERLTLFLRVPGAPLDNNVCERALKKAILHRKNAMFYLTEHGAQVGDLFMSLIHTCQLGGVNPFDYLTTLQQHAAELALNPAGWMPWNYRDTSGQ